MKSRPIFQLAAWVYLLVGMHLIGADLSGTYAWKPMKIGGGGWIVGMDISATEKGLMYCRTDVSGAYRWEPATATWKQIVTASSMPKDLVGYGRYGGVDSIVSAPHDPNLAYMAFNGQIFRSENRGDTWTATTFASHHVEMDANGDGRQEGERLGVDPANSNVVYYCPISGAAWFTEDGGATWRQVEGIPAGKPPHGINTIVFDSGGGTITTASGMVKTKVVFITVNRAGVYRTVDGGATWSNIAPLGPGINIEPRDAHIGTDRAYYVACTNENGAAGSCWKFTPQGKWIDITPRGSEGGSQAYAGVAVDPFEAAHVVLICDGGHGFVSNDGGATWSGRGFQLQSANIQWLGRQENYWLSVGEIAFDPFEKGRLWFAEGFGVWWTADLNSRDIMWHAASEGIEEACSNEVIAPPGGAPLSAMWDVGVFRFTDPDTYSATRAYPFFCAAWALDWCPSDPKFIAGIFRNNLGFPPHVKLSGFSTDGGLTWQRFGAVANNTLPPDLEYGAIAVSATNTDHLLWCPAGEKMPYYTTDRGATWKAVDLGGPTGAGIGGFSSGQKPICADRVLADTFYLYRAQDGGIYRSTDAGAHFAQVGSASPHMNNAVIKATPGRANDLWISEGDGGQGLKHSVDGGKTWVRIPALEQSFNFGLGKAEKEGGFPAIYADGIIDGVTGIYRSTDAGATWDKICDYPLGIFEWVDAMDGDKNVFGKIYLGFAQAGLAYGELKSDVKP
jgi:photosystem II stability/assembly factor-like uncharacterized protein